MPSQSVAVYSAVEQYFLEKLHTQHAIESAKIEQLEAWWTREHAAEEGLLAFLIRHEILRATAERCLKLFIKGLVAGQDLNLVMHSDGFAKLDSALAGIGPTPRLPVEPLSQRRTVAVAETLWNDPPAPTGTMHASFQHRSTRIVSQPDFVPLPAVGQMLGRCLLTRELGRGGNGIVFAALHRTLNVSVAVKVLIDSDMNPLSRQLLRDEASRLARVNHPNIVRVLDCDDGQVPYVVLELIEGMSLSELITQTGGLRERQAISLMMQMASGLSAAWNVGLIHRDVKPANILMPRVGPAKLVDLGLALCQSAPDIKRLSSNTQAPVGTFAYMAPEQAAGDVIDWRADQYALGVTFYHALTGKLPFSGRSPADYLLKHASQTPVAPATLCPGAVSEGVSQVIMQMLEKHPADRFTSAEELLLALSNVA